MDGPEENELVDQLYKENHFLKQMVLHAEDDKFRQQEIALNAQEKAMKLTNELRKDKKTFYLRLIKDLTFGKKKKLSINYSQCFYSPKLLKSPTRSFSCPKLNFKNNTEIHQGENYVSGIPQSKFEKSLFPQKYLNQIFKEKVSHKFLKPSLKEDSAEVYSLSNLETNLLATIDSLETRIRNLQTVNSNQSKIIKKLTEEKEDLRNGILEILPSHVINQKKVLKLIFKDVELTEPIETPFLEKYSFSKNFSPPF